MMDWKEVAIEKLAERRERRGGWISNPVVGGDPTSIYNPGVVAHEAGHARIHTTPILGSLSGYAPALGMIVGGLAASGTGSDQQAASKIVQKIAPLATGVRLADEAGASLIGLKSLKKDVESGKMSREDYRAAQRGLLSAFGSYGTHAAIQHGIGNKRAMTAANLTALTGAMLSERGGMTAEEAAKKVHEITPGTDVYAIDTPIGRGSFYISKAKTPIGGLAHRALFAAVLPQNEITRLSERGGVVIAPIHAGSLATGLAEQMVGKVSPLGALTPMLTYPSGIRKGRRIVVDELEKEKGDVMNLERARREGGVRGALYKMRHPLEAVGIVGQPDSSPPKGKKEAPPKKEEAPKEKAASASPHVQYLHRMLTEAQAA